MKVEAARVKQLEFKLESLSSQLAKLTGESTALGELKEAEIKCLVFDITAMSKQLAAVRSELSEVGSELVASDSQNDDLLQQLEDLRSDLVGVRRELSEAEAVANVNKSRSVLLDELAVAELELNSLRQQLAQCAGFNTPLLMFGHPVEIRAVMATGSQYVFNLVTSYPGGSEDEKWRDFVEWLKANDAQISADLGDLFHD